jgi:hypothetical protein
MAATAGASGGCIGSGPVVTRPAKRRFLLGRRTLLPAAVALLGMIAGACGSSSEDRPATAPGPTTTVATVDNPTAPTTGPASTAPSSGAEAGTATLLVAGDIADCGSRGDEGTAALLDANPTAAVATLGDNVYDSGTRSEFADCYGPSWGRHKGRTRPAPGNHEYGSDGARPYYEYFGEAAGEPEKGYYSYDLGPWHVVVVNSNCGEVACGAGSAQEAWLRADLAAHPARCTLAYWHHPRFSSGSRHGSTPGMAPIWKTLYELGADVVLAGHDHDYERLAPLDPSGKVDQERGIRSFVVGTGGKSHSGFGGPLTGSEVRNGDTFGVLELTLKPIGYDWKFIPQPGFSFTDSGSGDCH